MSLNGDPMPSETGERDRQAKMAGHMIYGSVHSDETPPYGIPPPLPESSNMMESGVTLDPLGRNGKMSSTRRTFCLFVAFDVILIFILWVIYTQLIGDTGYHAFETQVIDYNFKHSLFDTVMLSALRFTILLLAYCLYRSRHWFAVAISTALSSAILIAKIFVYQFSSDKDNPLSYCLIIISFVLAWVETWFLDFKVLPHEKKLEYRINQDKARANYGAAGLGSRYHRLSAEDGLSVFTEDNQFYSPLNSPHDSDNEDGPHRSTRTGNSSGGGDYRSIPSSSSNTRQDNDYIRLGQHSFDVLWAYINSPEADWKLETGKDDTTGIVHSKKIKSVGKVFRLQVLLDMAPQRLFEETSFKTDEVPTWNPTMKESRTLQVVDSNTDVIYTITGEIAGGVISSRDFVNVRRWGEKEGIYIGAGMACNHPDMPQQKNHIRGVNGAGGWVYKPVPGEPDKCLFYWYMNTDIKGWFPQKLIDANMAKVQMDFAGYITAFITKLKEESTS